MGTRYNPGTSQILCATPAVSSQAVESQVEKILASPLFRNSARLGKFLRYTVAVALHGKSNEIKEQLIGIEVFGRPTSYDPRTDSVVRVEAGRLRSKLQEYYRTEGCHDGVVIEMPKGSYVPLFRSCEQSDLAEFHVPPSSSITAGSTHWRQKTMLWALPVTLFISIGIGLTWRLAFRSQHTMPTSIAVLPFLNLSPSTANDYVSDGLSEELTTSLGALQDLRVVARTSAFQFRGKGEDVRTIGRALNVGAVLEGSVRKQGESWRITAQLIDTQDGYHLWSGMYDGESENLYAVEDDIIRKTASALRVAVPPHKDSPLAAGRSVNPRAHDLYLEGRYFYNKRDLPDMERSIQLFEAAIRQDPNFALAYAGLADSYVVLGGNGQRPLAEVVPRAKAALARALELDPKQGEPYAAMALLNSESSGERRGLEPDLRRAIELSPGYSSAHHWLGSILSGQARFEEANAELRKAQILDPLSPIITEAVAENFYFWRRYDDAIQQVGQIRKMGSDLGDEVLGRAFIQKARYQDAIDVFSRLRSKDSTPQASVKLAIAYAAEGQKHQARNLLGQAISLQKGYVPPYWIAVAYVYLGEKDTAFRWLQRALRQNDPMLGALRVEPMLDPIRSDPRYLPLLRKADLAD